MIARRIRQSLPPLVLIPVLAVLASARAVPSGVGDAWGPFYKAPAQPRAPSTHSSQQGSASTSWVRRWNEIAIDASGLDHTPVAPGENRVFGEQFGPGRASRAMAIVHIAIFDAVNAIAGGYRSYGGLPLAPRGTSMKAAVAQAAHDTLVALFPSQTGSFDARLEEDLGSIQDAVARGKGIDLGHRAAAAILALRAGDGAVTPTVRTEDQTIAGIYWAYDGTPSLCAPPRLYNQIAVTIADRMGSDTVGLARLLALANVAMADAGVAIWESKYYYQFWRPVTGIREADPGTGPTGAGDGNPATVGDPTFMPLGAPASNLAGPNFTPPFPAYPSGHAGFGGALFQTLRTFYGTDDIAFTFVSDEFDGVTQDNGGNVRPLLPRSFSSLSEAEEENGQSRIYLGIHWAFDKTEGIAQGRRVADYVFANAFAPLPRTRSR